MPGVPLLDDSRRPLLQDGNIELRPSTSDGSSVPNRTPVAQVQGLNGGTQPRELAISSLLSLMY